MQATWRKSGAIGREGVLPEDLRKLSSEGERRGEIAPPMSEPEPCSERSVEDVCVGRGGEEKEKGKVHVVLSQKEIVTYEVWALLMQLFLEEQWH